MKWWQRLRKGKQLERQLDAELAFHLEGLVAEHMAGGMSEDEARRRARLEFGGMDQVKEECRDARGTMWVEAAWQDTRLALRSLRKTPGFAAAAICTLALGIGANTAIFSVVYAVLLKPLPYANPDELVAMSSYVPQMEARFPSMPVRAVDFLEYRRTATAFAGLSALAPIELNLTGSGEPERLNGARVSANFFSTVGVAPERGRAFDEAEDQTGRDQVAIISHELWVRRYGADPRILEQTVSLNGQAHTIVGILPAGFLFPTGRQLHPLLAFGPRVDVWKPMAFTRDNIADEGSWDYGVIARVRSGTSAAVAQEQMDRITAVISARVRKQAQIADLDIKTRLTPIRQIFSGEIRRELLLLAGAVALLLVIACVNLANLMLARMSSRSRELATRTALGASRSRLVAQLLTESAVIAALGGAAGLLTAFAGIRVLIAVGPAQFPSLQGAGLNPPVLLFTALTALVTAVMFGIVPAFVTAYRNPQEDLRAGSRAFTSGTPGLHLRRLLVATEVALCSSLLVMAALLLHSFVNVLSVDKGFVAERVLTMDLSLPARSYDPAQVPQFYEEVISQARGLPGVVSAGAVTILPLRGESNTRSIRLENDTDYTQDVNRPIAVARSVSADYFRTLGVRLVTGRFFAEQEPQPVVIVSEGLAGALWPGEPAEAAIGRRVRHGDIDTPLKAIVGVVSDVKSGPLDGKNAPAIYRPHSQEYARNMTLVIKTSGDPVTIVAALRARIRQLDANLPMPAAETLDQVVAASVATRRFQMVLTAWFAIVALALGIVGVYGVTSYAVQRRTQEIGVRMAFGASQSRVVATVLAQGLQPVVAGLAIGMIGAIAAARSVRSFLYGIEALDPLALTAGCAVLFTAAALACYVPARRAAHVDPVAALRAD